jgi:hypothetical protein
MATPEIASSPPTINFGVIRSPRNNTLEIKANTGRPKERKQGFFTSYAPAVLTLRWPSAAISLV